MKMKYVRLILILMFSFVSSYNNLFSNFRMLTRRSAKTYYRHSLKSLKAFFVPNKERDVIKTLGTWNLNQLEDMNKIKEWERKGIIFWDDDDGLKKMLSVETENSFPISSSNQMVLRWKLKLCDIKYYLLEF